MDLKYESTERQEYSKEYGYVVARTMYELNNRELDQNYNFVETYSLKQGIKKFGDHVYKSAQKEVGQLHERKCFYPVNVHALTELEKKRAMQAIVLIVEKQDTTMVTEESKIKTRVVANGSIQRDWIQKEDAASPTASLESIILTAGIEAHEEREVATVDVPNAFIQATVKYKPNQEWITMKVQGALVDMLIELEPDVYRPCVVYEKGVKTLYLIVLRAIYGMLQSALLFYQKFRKDLENYGFVFNHMIHA